MSVLVTDGHFRKTLAVVRSLGRRGIHVTVGERTCLNTSFFSKYCFKRLVYPSPRRSPDRFIEFLLNEIKRNDYDCLFPMEEETLLLLAKYHSEISQYTYLLVPDLKKVEFVRDKRNLMQFAEAHGIPMPKTYYHPPTPEPCKGQGSGPKSNEVQGSPASNVVQDLNQFVDKFPIPAVIKPRISSGSFGIVYVKKERISSRLIKASTNDFLFHSFKNGFLMEGEPMVSLPSSMRPRTLRRPLFIKS